MAVSWDVNDGWRLPPVLALAASWTSGCPKMQIFRQRDGSKRATLDDGEKTVG